LKFLPGDFVSGQEDQLQDIPAIWIELYRHETASERASHPQRLGRDVAGMPVVEDFLKEAADSNVKVLAVGEDAKLGADAEIFWKDDAGYFLHRESSAEIFGAFLACGDGLGEAILIGSG